MEQKIKFQFYRKELENIENHKILILWLKKTMLRYNINYK